MIIALLAASAVITVVDGDTLRIGDDAIRLHGVDAPETHRPGCLDELILGLEASSFVAVVANSATSVAVSPVENSPDRYGRVVARVAINGRDLGEMLIEAHLAKPWDYDGGEKKPRWC